MKKSAVLLLAGILVFQLTACSRQHYIPTYAGTGNNKRGKPHGKKLDTAPCPCNKKKKK